MPRRWEIVSVAAPQHRGWDAESFAAVLAEHSFEHDGVTLTDGYFVAFGAGIPVTARGPQCHAPTPHNTIVLRIATVERE